MLNLFRRQPAPQVEPAQPESTEKPKYHPELAQMLGAATFTAEHDRLMVENLVDAGVLAAQASIHLYRQGERLYGEPLEADCPIEVPGAHQQTLEAVSEVLPGLVESMATARKWYMNSAHNWRQALKEEALARVHDAHQKTPPAPPGPPPANLGHPQTNGGLGFLTR
jgi:hypothetical protein